MRDVSPRLRLFLYSSASILSVLAVAALLILNWLVARPAANEPSRRLRWAAFAKTDLTGGSVITANQLRWQLLSLPEGPRYVLSSGMAVGRYARRDIGEGMLLDRDDFKEFAPDDAPAGGAVLPVEVKTEHIRNVRPGSRLAFVQDKKVLPELKKGEVETGHRGFLLLAIGPSERDSSLTILTVKIEADNVESVQLLGTGQWRPVVLKGRDK